MAALETEGYQPEISGDRSTHFPPLVPPFAGFRVEVHTELDPRTQYFSFARWASTLVPWESFPGLSVPTPTQHFLYLIQHALERHELKAGLLALADFKFWIELWAADEWDALVKAAGELNLQRQVGLALTLMSWFWEEPLAQDIVHRYPSPPEELLLKSVEIMLTGGGRLAPHLWRDLPEFTLRGWFAYMRLVLLGNPQVRSMLPLHKKLAFFLLRPLRLLRHYAPIGWRLLSGDSQSRASWQSQRELMRWLRSGE